MQIKVVERDYDNYQKLLFKYFVRTMFGFCYRSVTNIIKPLIGKEKYFQPYDAFISVYLQNKFRLGRKIPEFEITSSTRPYEGAATQALMAMYAMNFSLFSGIPYVHTRFSNVAHADRQADDWADAWEEYFNLGFNESVSETKIQRAISLPDAMYQIQYIYDIPDFAKVFEKTLPVFKQKYLANKSQNLSHNRKINVCIHVRRGDVEIDKNSEMWTSISSVKACLDHLLKLLANIDHEIQLNLFSVGEKSSFRELNGMKINFHLNTDPIWTHKCLVETDILIAAKSNFSYLAALLGEAVVIYEPSGVTGRFTPLEHWLARDEDGKFDVEKFKIEFKRLLNLRGKD